MTKLTPENQDSSDSSRPNYGEANSAFPMVTALTIRQAVDQLGRVSPIRWEGEYAYGEDDRLLDGAESQKGNDGSEDGDVTARVHLTLERNGTGLRIWGQGEATLPFTCDRCLTPFEQTIPFERTEEFLIVDFLPAHYRDEEWVSGYADEDESFNLDDTLDVKDLVRQWLVLESAGRHLCGDEQCQGEPAHTP